MSKIVVEMSGDEAKLLQSLQRVIDKQSQVGKEAGKASKKANRGFGIDFVRSAKMAVTGLVGAGGVMAALKLIGNEIDQVQSRWKRAGQAVRSIADTRQSLRFVMDKDQFNKAIEDSRQISMNTTVDQGIIQGALATAFSASQGKYGMAREAVETAAKISPDRPENIEMMSGAFLDVAKALNVSIKDAVGYVMVSMRDARITDLSKLSANLPKAITGAKGLGFTDSGSAALFTATTANTADFTGEQSRTASISFAQQLDEFFKTNKLDVTGGANRIAYLQNNQEMGEKFLSKMSVEKQAVVPFQQLIRDRDSQIAKDFTNFRGSYTRKNLDKTYQYQTSRDLDGQGMVNYAGRSIKNQIKLSQIENPSDALRGILEGPDGMIALFREWGMGALAEKGEELKEKISVGKATSSVIDSYMDDLTKQLSTLDNPLTVNPKYPKHWNPKQKIPDDYFVPRLQNVNESKSAERLRGFMKELTLVSGSSRRIETLGAQPALQQPDEKRQEMLTQSADNLNKSSDGLNKASDRMSSMVHNLDRSIANLNKTTADLKTVIDDAKRNKIAANRSAALQQGR